MSQQYYTLDTIEDFLDNFDRLYGKQRTEVQKAALNQALADINVLSTRGATVQGSTRTSLIHDIEERLRYL